MPQDTRSSPPVAVRVVRPFATEAELLDSEAGAFTRTGVVLIGAASRPNGVVLRFEMTLRDGTAVMRGEGRVVGYRPPSASDEGALMLRFTRLDVKSKALLDRAVTLREERRSLVPPGGRSASQTSMPAIPHPVAAATPAGAAKPSIPSRPPAIPRTASATPPRPSIPSVAPTVQASPSPTPSEVTGSIDVQVDDDDVILASDDAGSERIDAVDGSAGGDALDASSESDGGAEIVANSASAADARIGIGVPVDDDDDGDAEEVDAAEVEEVEDASPVMLDEGDLTVQAPPVMMSALAVEGWGQSAVALETGPGVSPEHFPAPNPSPPGSSPNPRRNEEPEPVRRAPEAPTAPQRSPEHAPGPRRSPERAPAPGRSPEPVRKLEGNVREGALERLRARAKKLTELTSFFPAGERSSAPDQPPVTASVIDAGPIDPSHTPVLGSYVTEGRDDET